MLDHEIEPQTRPFKVFCDFYFYFYFFIGFVILVLLFLGGVSFFSLSSFLSVFHFELVHNINKLL